MMRIKPSKHFYPLNYIPSPHPLVVKHKTYDVPYAWHYGDKETDIHLPGTTSMMKRQIRLNRYRRIVGSSQEAGQRERQEEVGSSFMEGPSE